MRFKTKIAVGLAACLSAGAAGITVAEDEGSQMVSVKAMADALHIVMDSDRTVYTKVIVNRLVKKDKVIKATEHFEDDQALALPAQMFRLGSDLAPDRA